MRSALAALLCAAIVISLAACQPDQIPPVPGKITTPASVAVGNLLSTPTPQPTATPTPTPTPTPTEVPVGTPARRAGSVGLVAPLDQPQRLRVASETLQATARQLGVDVALVPAAPADTVRNVMRLAEAGYEMVLVASHNPQLGVWAAQRYPATRFVVFGRLPDLPDQELSNLTGIEFAEDQAGFLAGALAGWLTNADMVAFVGAAPNEEIVKYRKGYEHGVRYVNSKAVVMGNYLDSYGAPEKGAAEARAQLDEGADILFAAGGATARGALEAAAQRGVAVIAADADVYTTLPKVAPWLAGAAVVRTDKAIADTIRAAQQGTLKPGTLVYDIKSGGVELGPYYDWATRIPERAREQLLDIFADLQKGTVKTNVVIPIY